MQLKPAKEKAAAKQEALTHTPDSLFQTRKAYLKFVHSSVVCAGMVPLSNESLSMTLCNEFRSLVGKVPEIPGIS